MQIMYIKTHGCIYTQEEFEATCRMGRQKIKELVDKGVLRHLPDEAGFKEIEAQQIIKQSVVPTELCDCFVMIIKDKEPAIVKTYDEAKKLLHSYKEDGIEAVCQGSVWGKYGLTFCFSINEQSDIQFARKKL